MTLLLVATASCVSSPATRQAAPDVDVRALAESYLNAISGKGDEAGYGLLLGGASTNARLFALENWRIVKEEPARHEEADLGEATTMSSRCCYTECAIL